MSDSRDRAVGTAGMVGGGVAAAFGGQQLAAGHRLSREGKGLVQQATKRRAQADKMWGRFGRGALKRRSALKDASRIGEKGVRLAARGAGRKIAGAGLVAGGAVGAYEGARRLSPRLRGSRFDAGYQQRKNRIVSSFVNKSDLDELRRLERQSPYARALESARSRDGDAAYDVLRSRHSRLSPAQRKRVRRAARRTMKGVDPFNKAYSVKGGAGDDRSVQYLQHRQRQREKPQAAAYTLVGAGGMAAERALDVSGRGAMRSASRGKKLASVGRHAAIGAGIGAGVAGLGTLYQRRRINDYADARRRFRSKSDEGGVEKAWSFPVRRRRDGWKNISEHETDIKRANRAKRRASNTVGLGMMAAAGGASYGPMLGGGPVGFSAARNDFRRNKWWTKKAGYKYLPFEGKKGRLRLRSVRPLRNTSSRMVAGGLGAIAVGSAYGLHSSARRRRSENAITAIRRAREAANPANTVVTGTARR